MKVEIIQYEEAPIVLEDARIIAIDGDDITFESNDGRLTVNVEEDVMRLCLEKDKD